MGNIPTGVVKRFNDAEINSTPARQTESQGLPVQQPERALQLFTASQAFGPANRMPATSEQRLQTALHQVDVLTDDNARLRREAARLAQMVVHAQRHSYHDPLTGLASQRLLIDRFNQVQVLAQRQRKQVGFMMLDLNGLGDITDRLGPDAEEDILCHVADCLSGCTRGSDTVCRYGAHRFVIMLPELDHRERISTLAAKIHARLAGRYSVHGIRIAIATGIGVAIYPSDGDNFRELIKQADISMDWAKTNTRTRTRLLGGSAASTTSQAAL